MANTLQLQHTRRPIFERVNATLCAAAHAVASEHALALRAATRAALPHQHLAEVRAMYVAAAPPAQSAACLQRVNLRQV